MRVGWGGSVHQRYRGLLKFDLSVIPAGQTIDSAVLYLRLASGSADVTIDKATGTGATTWDEGSLTWNNPAQSGWTYTSATADTKRTTAGQYYTWDIYTSSLSVGETVTLAARDEDATNEYAVFCTKEHQAHLRPYLKVTYTPEPATMVLLGLGGIGVLLKRRRRA